MNRFKQKRFKWLIWGISLSFLGPLGEWILLRIAVNGQENTILWTYIYSEIAALVAFASFGYILGSYADRLEQLAITDKLTGLYNRHFIIDRLRELLNNQQRYSRYFSIIMMDLDHFKQVNDTHGHVIGDRTLKAVAKTISIEVRGTDHPCRFGGEEFLILCPHTNIEEAYNLAERIRLKISDLGESDMGYAGPQTISAGVYEVSGGQIITSANVLSKVDEALYCAKNNGRNQVARLE